MDIQHKDNFPQGGLFYIERDGKKIAEMSYVWSGSNIIIIDHTAVDEILKGQGAGKQLVQQAVDFARKKDLKIIPLCPFAKAVFDKTSLFIDVLL